MNCRSFNNVVDLYREGRLTPRRMKAAAKHIETCAACRAASGGPPATASPRAPKSLKDRLRAAVQKGSMEKPAAPVAELPLWPREARGIALAAAALLVVGFLIAAVGAPSQSSANGVAAVEEP